MRVDEWVGSRSIHSVFNVSLKMAFGRSRGCRGERIVRSVFD